jgi:predicted permease
LLARPISAIAMVLVLGVTIGLCVVLSYWVDALFLQPLSVPRASELVTFQRTFDDRGVTQRRTSMTWSQAQRAAHLTEGESSAIASAADDTIARRLAIEWSPTVAEDAPVEFVSPNYGRVLGARVAVGRDLAADDDRAGAVPVALVSHQAWQRRWGGRDDVIGQVVKINDTPVTIVGVAAQAGWVTNFLAPGPALFLPLGSAPAVASGMRDDNSPMAGPRPLSRFQVVARVPGGRDALTANLRSAFRSDQWATVPLSETLLPFDTRQELSRFLQLLALAAGSTLVIACINVAVLMFGAAHARRQELAVQVALGATPSRIGQMFVCDAVVVAAASGATGYVVALAVNAIIVRLDIANFVVTDVFAFDALRLGVYACILGVGVALLVGLLPVRWAVSRAGRLVGDATALRGRRTTNALRVVVAAQAAACVVLSASGLYFVSVLVTGLQKDLGFDPAGGLYHAKVVLTPAQRERVHAVNAANMILSDVLALPAVSAASLGPGPFFDNPDRSTATFHVDGEPVVTADPVDLVFVSPTYFATLRQRIVRGRTFSPEDIATDGQGFVAVLNEPAAALFWGGREAIGGRLVLDHFARVVGPVQGTVTCRFDRPDGPPTCSAPTRVTDCLVIGTVPGAVTRHIGESPRPVIYLPLSQWGDYRASAGNLTGTVSMLVRTRETLDVTARLLDGVARSRGLAIDDVSSVLEARNAMLRPARLVGLVLMAMAVASLAVSMIAIYATSRDHVARQERATAIRLALGAAHGTLVRHTIAPLGYALGAGTVAGLVALTLIRVYVEPLGLQLPFLRPFTIGVPAVLVVACGLAAAYMAARRVYRVQPARLLRE